MAWIGSHGAMVHGCSTENRKLEAVKSIILVRMMRRMT